MIGRVYGKYRFWARRVFNAELLEICKFISPRDIFPVLAPVRPFNCRRQIENEFVAPALARTTGFVHEAENPEN